ncbi:MAG: hypothetical protein ABIS06_06865 [Vicinamibacterales bacterium]
MEDKANSSSIIDTLKHEIGGIIAVTPEGGKYARASMCEPKVEAGNVYLPTRWRFKWHASFQETLTAMRPTINPSASHVPLAIKVAKSTSLDNYP